MNLSNKNRKSQITIFVILALIIVVAIALGVVLFKKPVSVINIEEDPQAFIESCVKDSIEKHEQIILDNNGYPNITSNFLLYENEKVPFLCTSSQFYVPCVNQEPMLVESIRRKLEDRIKLDAKNCFETLIKDLRKKGYNIQEGNMSLNVILRSGKIGVDINKKIVMTKGENSQIIESWRTFLPSPLFNLIDTARNIVNYESTLCEFNDMVWMNFFPAIRIIRFITSEGSKVYLLTDKESEKELKIAIRTCVLPAGI